MMKRYRVKALAFALPLLLLGACKTQLDYLKIDGDFSPHRAESCLYYIARTTYPGVEKEPARSGDIVMRAIAGARRRFALKDEGALRGLLQEKDLVNEYRASLKEYEISGTVLPTKIMELGKGLGQGCIVYTRVSSYSVSRRRETHYVSEYKGSGKRPADKRKIEARVDTRIRGRMTVFDLSTARLMFDAEHELSHVSSILHDEERHVSRNMVGKVVSAILYSEDSLYPYPEPPRPGEMAKELFETIAGHLPGK